jgi:hypothetical protein
VVPPAEQQEIVDGACAAVGPVVDIVGVDEPAVLTAREATAAVSCAERV